MLLGELELSGAGFLETIRHLDEKFSGFVDKVGKVGGVLTGSFVAFEGINKVIEGFEGTLELGGHLRDLSMATGQTVHDLVILRHAFELTGGSAEEVQTFLFKLQTGLS